MSSCIEYVSVFLAKLRGDPLKVRFLAAGGANTVFGLLIFPVLLLVLGPIGFHYMVVLVICQALAVTFAYGTYKTYVFRNSRKLSGRVSEILCVLHGLFLGQPSNSAILR